jgi:hypothetical protein
MTTATIARHPRFVDMLGRRIGRLVVVEEAPTERGTARWLCKCDCGETVIREGIYLRDAQKRGVNAACATCNPPRRGPVNAHIRVQCCSVCHVSGHDRRDCPKRKRKRSRCTVCEGLPWRRPMRRECACGEKYAPAPVPERPDAFAQSANAKVL